MYQPERIEGLDISEYTFIQFGGMQISDGMRMFGDKAAPEDSYKPTRIHRITTDMEKSIVAVLHSPPREETFNGSNDLSMLFLQSNVAGYVYIVKIYPETNRMDVLSPCPGQLPTKNLLVGSLKWTE